MTIFQVPVRLLSRYGSGIIIPITELFKNPLSVKLSFASYDIKNRELADKLENPPLLIMHGLYGSKGNWKSICKSLQSHTNLARKIIAVDARNHGDSAHSNEHTYEACAGDIKALLQAENIPKVALMGHSWGGRVCMFLALMNPDLVERLIIVDVSPRSEDFNKDATFAKAMDAIQVPPTTVLSTARATVDAALSPTVTDKGVRHFLLTNLIQKPDGAVAWRLNLRSLKENYNNITQFPIDSLHEAKYLGPTTFILGGASNYVQDKDRELIKILFPNVIFSSVPGCAHWVHSEKPAEFVQIVLNTLNESKI